MKSINLIPSQTAAGSITSTYYDLGDYTACAVQVTFSDGAGNLAGTLTLESCATDPVTQGFLTVASSSVSVTSSASTIYNVTGAGYRYLRVKWVYTSGTGNILANLSVKQNAV